MENPERIPVETNSMKQNRREFIGQVGMASILAAESFPFLRLASKAQAGALLPKLPTAPSYVPHSVPLPLPGRLAPTVLDPAPGSPAASLGSAAVYHGIAPEYSRSHPAHKPYWDKSPERHYEMAYEETLHEWVPGIQTPALGYNGLVPAATIRLRVGEPAVVRVTNKVDIEASVHLHGGHNPSHADGHPCFYVFPGQSRDYYYPNVLPRHPVTGEADISHSNSTLWFHDHANDVTSRNVIHGLAGFALLTDDLEEKLFADRILPALDTADGQQSPYDVPMAFIDQALNPDGTIFWDPLDADGRLGNILTVNGAAQPYFEVERRKYRFRWLGCSLARVYELRIVRGSTDIPLLQISNDGYLFPQPELVSSVLLIPGKRADVIVDFSKFEAGTKLYLQNIMQQSNGRKPDGIDPTQPMNLVEFRVKGPAVANDVSVALGSALRPYTPIEASEVTATRRFDFNRSNGAWQINGQFWSPFRSDAVIPSGTTERWFLQNNAGGWWHPAHIHLENHQIVSINGVKPKKVWSYLCDTSPLEGNMVIEVLVRFRTFTGPFVFHCHNNNHEDMRMMSQIETVPRNPVTGLPMPPMLKGKSFSVDPAVCGIPARDIEANPHLFH